MTSHLGFETGLSLAGNSPSKLGRPDSKPLESACFRFLSTEITAMCFSIFHACVRACVPALGNEPSALRRLSKHSATEPQIFFLPPQVRMPNFVSNFELKKNTVHLFFMGVWKSKVGRDPCRAWLNYRGGNGNKGTRKREKVTITKSTARTNAKCHFSSIFQYLKFTVLVHLDPGLLVDLAIYLVHAFHLQDAVCAPP